MSTQYEIPSGLQKIYLKNNPLFFFLPVFHQCAGCLEWGLMAGLWGFASHGAVFYLRAGMAGHSGSPWVAQAPTFHLSEAVG